jgi:hypothetical protein
MNDQQREILDRWIADAERDAKRSGEGLKGLAQMISSRMSNVIRSVDSGLGVNDLGELQGSGPSLDVKCAVYGEKHDRLESLKYLRERLVNVDLNQHLEVNQ